MINWIKQNKLASILLLIFTLFLSKDYLFRPVQYSSSLYKYGSSDMAVQAPGSKSYSNVLPPSSGEYAPTNQKDRLVVQESSLSLVVRNVREASDQIVNYAKQNDGFMVSQNLSSPEEVPFATITVRIPSAKLQQVLSYYRNLAMKVSSENLLGTDVTDEYVDIDARLATLNKTKAKFEEIMAKAVNIQDILNIQRELINLQDQIDSLKGRQNYLEKTAQLARITIYLSTDEFSLPYAPSETFRPEVIFKRAVRSLVLTLRGLAEKAIWVAVYSAIWIPLLLVIYFVNRWYQKRNIIDRQN